VRLFLDAIILVDVFQARPPFLEHSLQLWSLAENRKAEVFISAFSFNNIYYIMRKHSGMEAARRAMEVLNANFGVVPLGQDIINKAISAKKADFEDSLQFYSALSIGAESLVTRNVRDFPADILPILTPKAFLASFGEEI